jgi:hypothetical protein
MHLDEEEEEEEEGEEEVGVGGSVSGTKQFSQINQELTENRPKSTVLCP